MDNVEYLAGYPLLRTADLDEARHGVTAKFCDHRLELATSTPLFVRHNHVAGRAVSLNYLHYGADVRIDPGMLGDFYLLQIPLSGGALIDHRGAEVTASAQTATLLNPDRETRMQWSGACRKLLVQIDKDHLTAVAEAMTGAPLPGPVRFDPKVRLGTADGQRLKQFVLSCVWACETEGLFRSGNAQDGRIEHDLAEALLTLQPSNVSHILARRTREALPKEIRRAVDFIYAHLPDPITSSDIARAAGINVRTLQMGIMRAFGTSPTRFVRDARLDAAHYQLSARIDPPSVTTAAYANGFSHLGRFSRDYKARFGRLPSGARKRR
ncbi:MAG: AraC family transcriptional regulator [Pseudomonadota bacterium]